MEIFSKDLDEAAETRRLSALDLGAGAGNETIYLLKRNWDVVAIDIAPYAIETIKRRAQNLGQPKGSVCCGKLAAHLTSMEEVSLEDESFDLVNASLSLPFVPKSRMQQVWTKIVRSLKPGGTFTGHFFGPEHQWKDSPKMSFYSNQQLFDELFNSAPIEVRYLTNEKKWARLGNGTSWWLSPGPSKTSRSSFESCLLVALLDLGPGVA